MQMPPVGNINVAADETISIPRTDSVSKPDSIKEVFASVENTWSSSMEKEPVAESKKETTVENNLEEKYPN